MRDRSLSLDPVKKVLTARPEPPAWLSGLPARVEPSTVTNYADMVKTHLKLALGAKILSQLTVSDVNALWAEKRVFVNQGWDVVG